MFIILMIWNGWFMSSEKIDLKNKCVHCKQDTSYGSGKFVNRYPVFGLDPDGTGTEYDGYCCDDCEQEWDDEQKRI